MAKLYFQIYFSVLLELVVLGYGDRTKNKMYEKIYNADGCFRRMNATHQIGCTSKRGGSTGIVHYSDTLEELNYILQNGTAPPYIPIIPTKLFTPDNLKNLIESDKVSGLILHPNNDTLDHFTHEHKCPNPSSSLPGSCQKNSVWNPFGTGLLYADIPFPMFYVENEGDVLKIKDCFQKFNNFSYDDQGDRSLCALELKSFMHATTNTPTCRRRSNIITNLNPMRFCDPLGDNNVWASLYPLVSGNQNDTKPIKDHKYIVIAARLDTTSMFELTAGANSPVSGLVTLLSTAKLLKTILTVDDIEKGKKNVLFMVFNGETYDYIGSQRMLYDMTEGNFPVEGLEEDNNILPVIRPENISLFIELSQLGNSVDKNVYVHYLQPKSEIVNFYQTLTSNGGPVVLHNVSGSLPPASLHTFLRNDGNFPGLIIADHEKSYANKYYHSLYDNSSNIGFIYYNTTENEHVEIPDDSIQRFIAQVSETVAKSVYEEVKGEAYKGKETTDVNLVDELLHCYLDDLNCKIHSATQKNKFPIAPGYLYVGVDHSTNFATTLTLNTLGWFVGDNVAEENCTNTPQNYAFRYYNMSKSLAELNVTACFKITMNLTDAVSPAFSIPGYDWSSGLYSTWTESTWSDMGVRLFLKPSSAHERITIAIGSMSVIFSFALVYFVKSRSHILFTSPLPTEAPTDC